MTRARARLSGRHSLSANDKTTGLGISDALSLSLGLFSLWRRRVVVLDARAARSICRSFPSRPYQVVERRSSSPLSLSLPPPLALLLGWLLCSSLALVTNDNLPVARARLPSPSLAHSRTLVHPLLSRRATVESPGRKPRRASSPFARSLLV